MSTARHHAEWLSLVEVSGPFLSMPVLMRVFPQGLIAHDSEVHRNLRQAHEEWEESLEAKRPDRAIHRAWVGFILRTVLEFEDEVIATDQAIQQTWQYIVPEHGETLRPDLVVKNPAGRTDTGKPRLIGFTRLEFAGDFDTPQELPPDQRAPLSRQTPSWVPASEIRGEGIFFQFSEKAIKQWEAKHGAYDDEFFTAHRRWREARKLKPDAGYPGIRFVLIHTFAHAVIRQLSIECGYTTASLRERIYCTSPDDDGHMAGVLIYTAAPDSEGTLGGLCALGRPDRLGHHLDDGESYAGIGRGDIKLGRIPVFVDAHGPFGSTTSDSERTMVRLDTKQVIQLIISFGGRHGLDEACAEPMIC